MAEQKTYLFVVDEMGTPGIAYGTSNTYVFGGYVVAESELDDAVRTWRQIKQDLCGNADAELKWKHFFVDDDDPHIPIPLHSRDAWTRQRQAAESLDVLLRNSSIRPAMAVCRKNRASDGLIAKSRKGKGKDKIDAARIWLPTVAQFALFLSLHRASGRLWLDCLGNKQQEEQRQAEWSTQLQMIKDGKVPPAMLGNLRKLLVIDEHIEFLDSEHNEAVQIADFVCGVIWRAGEGDESYLHQLLDEYGQKASREGLGIVRVS